MYIYYVLWWQDVEWGAQGVVCDYTMLLGPEKIFSINIYICTTLPATINILSSSAEARTIINGDVVELLLLLLLGDCRTEDTPHGCCRGNRPSPSRRVGIAIKARPEH